MIPGPSLARFWAATPLASGLLHALAFPPFDWGEAAFFWMLPSLIWLWRDPSRSLWWRAHLLGMWIGQTILLVWVRHAFAYGVPEWPPWAAAAVGWFLAAGLGAVVAVFPLAWWLAARWLLPRAGWEAGFFRRALLLVGLAGLWVVLEWVRTWFLSGFPWLPLAASQWQRPFLLQIVSLVGAGGLSGWLVLCNLALASYLYRLIHHRRGGWRRLCPEFYLVVLGLLGVSWHLWARTFPRQPEPLLRLGLVQPQVGRALALEPDATLGRIAATTRPLAALEPDLILWPEGALPYSVRDDPSMRGWAETAARSLGASILTGTVLLDRRPDGSLQWANAAAVVEPETGLAPATYAKRRLVPFGEYVPLRQTLPFLAALVPIGGDFTAGRDPSALTVHRARPARPFRAGVLICYEDVFADLAVSTVRTGADFLVVLTNNDWFGEEAGAYQHAAHSVLRAVETRRPVVRCGNAGWSGWIDEWGQIRSVLTDAEGSIYFQGATVVDVDRDVRWADRFSPYVKSGDWIVLVGGLAAALAALARPRRLPPAG